MKKILITGNSGYIGSHLSKMLKGEYEIHGIDLVDPQVDVKHSCWDINLLTRTYYAGMEFDAVIHLAALVNVNESVHDPINYYNTNIDGTFKVLKHIKFKNFILASTGAAEGCYSPYGVSKRVAEDYVRQYCQELDIDYTIFRFYNVIGSDGFGPTNPDGLMYNLMKAPDIGEFTIFGTDYDVSPDGTCVRDYVHVNEICDALKQAIEKSSNQVECLGHGVGYTVREIVDLFKKVNGVDFTVKTGPRRKGDLASSVLSDISPYMKNLYTIEQLLTVDK